MIISFIIILYQKNLLIIVFNGGIFSNLFSSNYERNSNLAYPNASSHTICPGSGAASGSTYALIITGLFTSFACLKAPASSSGFVTVIHTSPQLSANLAKSISPKSIAYSNSPAARYS